VKPPFSFALRSRIPREESLTEITGSIVTTLFDQVRPIENWGLHPHFKFRSQSEQQEILSGFRWPIATTY